MDKNLKYDFSGWATKNNILCSDGRTIIKDAFKDNDGQIVPLVWNHNHSYADNVLGHALLENRDNGVYAYCSFNNTKQGKNAMELVRNGDICSLSIYANKLQQNGKNVIHGAIREVSLVLAGANPGATIENVVSHGDIDDQSSEAAIYHPNDEDLCISHSDETSDEKKESIMEQDKNNQDSNNAENKDLEHSANGGDKPIDEDGKTVQQVFDTLNEDQKTVVYALVGEAHDEGYDEGCKNSKENKSTEDNKTMKQNAFDNSDNTMTGADETDNKEKDVKTLSHAEFVGIVKDANRIGSLKDSFFQHGITNVGNLYPEAQSVNKEPVIVDRKQDWANRVLNVVHHSPFSRIKTTYADATTLEARAKGYVKGAAKVEEVITAFKRITTPTTVYKLQKMDRDDVIDITDFDVIAWLKGEMRSKLNEELARAFLFGDGRSASDADKINEGCIRPIATDDAVYTVAVAVGTTTSTVAADAAELIDASVEQQDNYEGAGNPVAFVRRNIYTQMLLLKDTTGHRLYKDAKDLALAMSVSEVIPVPNDIMGSYEELVVDLSDYTVGADKGGAVSLFDDFDINYNKMEYLIETRCSGALTCPHAAIAFKKSSEAAAG